MDLEHPGSSALLFFTQLHSMQMLLIVINTRKLSVSTQVHNEKRERGVYFKHERLAV